MKCGKGMFGFFLFVFFLVGCGQQLPDNLPALQQCTLTLTSQGKPLAEASVSLIPLTNEHGQWIAGGVSDANGKVVPIVQGKYKGVPLGKYKVVVIKNRYETDETIAERIRKEYANNTRAERDRHMEIEIDKYAKVTIPLVHHDCMKQDTTPLEIEILKGKKKMAIDVPAP